MRHVLILLALFSFLLPRPVLAQESVNIAITSPQSGEIGQGLVVVTGSVTELGFASYELSFAYSDDPTGTWFTIQTSSLPVFENELGIWDTTILTDGDYSLRLRVFLLDGSFQDLTVTDLSVRNYSAMPTSLPTLTATAVSQFNVAPTAQLIAPELATETPSYPTPTPFPANPTGLGLPSISAALARGAMLVLLLFLGFGLLLRLRRY